MPDKRFIHLHLHSQYSLLDGAIKFDELLKRCKELGMDSVTLTRHPSDFSLLLGLLRDRTCPCPVGPLVS